MSTPSTGDGDLRKSSRTCVLLGAGASADAGLPMTESLARNLLKRFNADWDLIGAPPSWLLALNFVYGAMVGEQSKRGGDPQSSVNVERLISALRLLSSKESHEAAAFVDSWKPGAEGFGEPKSYSLNGRPLANAIIKLVESKEQRRRASDYQALASQVAKLARQASLVEGSGSFSEAEREVLRGIRDALSNPTGTEYLEPLGTLAQEQGGLDIITLNYDRTVESMAESLGLAVERGMAAWRPGVPLDFRASGAPLRLHKLHGSIDWMIKERLNDAEIPEISERPLSSKPRFFSEDWNPWIVAGDREKLGTDGPTLSLIRSATDALSEASHLAVVGYAFGDAHVNAMIRDWLSADSTRTLTVLTPNWTAVKGTFLDDLRWQYGIHSRGRVGSQILGLCGTAETSLHESLIPVSIAESNDYANFAVHRSSEDDDTFEVRLAEPEVVYDVRIQLAPSTGGQEFSAPDSLRITGVAQEESMQPDLDTVVVRVPRLQRGQGVLLRAVDTPDGEVTAMIECRRYDSHATEQLVFGVDRSEDVAL